MVAGMDAIATSGLDGVIALGSMGEFYTVSAKEFDQLVDTISDKAPSQLATVVGCSYQNTEECLRRVQYAQERGIDAAMVMPPYYLNVNQEEALEHYRIIDEKSDRIQIMAYNFPPASRFNITPEFWEKLVKFESITAVKESHGDLFHITRVIKEYGGRISVFAGSEGWFFPMSVLGSKSLVSIFGYALPALVKKFYDTCRSGNKEDALRMHNKFVDAMWFIDTYNEVAWLKALSEICGRNVGPPRPPYSKLDPVHYSSLETWVKSL